MMSMKEIGYAKSQLLEAAIAHVNDEFGAVEHQHELSGVPTVPIVTQTEYDADMNEIARVVLEYKRRLDVADTAYVLRYGYDKGHFSYTFYWMLII
jgi:hypothetical protein